jgi:hypothetical protein
MLLWVLDLLAFDLYYIWWLVFWLYFESIQLSVGVLVSLWLFLLYMIVGFSLIAIFML